MLYGFKDYRESIKLMATIDGFGLDVFEFFGIMALAGKLADRGIIPDTVVDPEIRLDSLESMEAWARKISLREGLGDVLAGGFKGIIEEYGDSATDLSPALVKGMHPYAGPGSAFAWDRLVPWNWASPRSVWSARGVGRLSNVLCPEAFQISSPSIWSAWESPETPLIGLWGQGTSLSRKMTSRSGRCSGILTRGLSSWVRWVFAP